MSAPQDRADNWRAGDLALCVRWRAPELATIRVGGVYTVRKVWDNIHSPGHTGVALDFADIERPAIDRAFDARCFRKIEPHKPDEFDRETIALMNGKPVPVSA